MSKSCIEVKINLNFYFQTSLWCLKKVLWRPCRHHEEVWPWTFQLIFFFRPGSGWGGLVSFIHLHHEIASSFGNMYCTKLLVAILELWQVISLDISANQKGEGEVKSSITYLHLYLKQMMLSVHLNIMPLFASSMNVRIYTV